MRYKSCNCHREGDADDGQSDGSYQSSNLDHHIYSSVDLYPVRPRDDHYTSEPMITRINDPWHCINDDPLPFNHHHPSTRLNGDCVQGVVILTSHDSDFSIKVTALTGPFSSYGIGRVKSHTYHFPLPPGTNIITWCSDSGFRYHPFPCYADLSYPSRSVISFPNTLDSLRKTYQLDHFHP